MKNGSERERETVGGRVRERDGVAEGCDKGWEEIVGCRKVTKWHPTTK